MKDNWKKNVNLQVTQGNLHKPLGQIHTNYRLAFSYLSHEPNKAALRCNALHQTLQ